MENNGLSVSERAERNRTVRIFISSTFRDFAQERDLLTRKVFPELRRRCRERQVELVDVDLRWGITEEEAQQGKVLPICLAEIDRARPFFIGLIGERYGWVPNQEQFDRSLLIEQPWLEEHAGGKSVTELEILHGVLNNPEMAGRAFFYFRSPDWSQSQGLEFASEGADQKRKLSNLKDRIRTSGFPLEEDYPDPEFLAERVRENLWILIEETFPETEVPGALVLERRRHEAYSSSLRRLYLGGERYFEVLDSEMASASPRPILVRGGSGGGKSALLANWLGRWSQTHPETAVILHHLGCGADAADPVRIAVRIMQEIALLVGVEFKSKRELEEQLDELAKWLATASTWAGRTGRKVLLVLDGLDKLADHWHMRWFPTVLPPGVHLVASCLDGEVVEAALPRLPWRELVVEPFTAAEQTRFIGEYLGRFRKQLTAEQTRMLQAHPLVGNPLFLLTVLEELRVFGVHEELSKRLLTLLSPPESKQSGEEPTVADVFEHVLARIEGDLGREVVQRVMESIWASRAGLCTDEILAIAEIPPATWAAIQNALDESLYESTGKINISHGYLRKGVEDRYAITGDRLLALHKRLAGYFGHREPDSRVAEELPWQWQKCGDHQHLHACLIDLALFPLLVRRNHGELLGYWKVLPVSNLSIEYEQAFNSWGGRATFAHLLVGDFLYFAGYYDDFVERIFHAWLKLGKKLGQSASIETLSSVNELAAMLLMRGKPVEAATLLQTEWLEADTSLPQGHPVSIRLNSTLACSLVAMEHEDAEWACRSLIAQLGSIGQTSTRDYGLAKYNLAECLNRKGQSTHDFNLLTEAEDCFHEAHHVLQEVLGPLDLETLRALRGQGLIAAANGRLDEAFSTLSRAHEGFLEVVGANHPDTLLTSGSLAAVLLGNGDVAGAEATLLPLVNQQSTLLGEHHPDVLISYSRLAQALTLQGRHEEAEGYFTKALDGVAATLGREHSLYLSIASLREESARENDLGVDEAMEMLSDLGDFAAAERLCRQVLAGRERTLGAAHPDTLASVVNLARLLINLGDYVAAERLYRRALVGTVDALGADHPDTLELVDAVEQCVDAITPIPDLHSVSDPPGTVSNSLGMKFVPIPAGEFLMGSADDCPFGDPGEEFQHRVRITKPFLLGMHQVTQAQYEKVSGENPSLFRGPNLPVEHLSWKDALRFCEVLSAVPEERAAGRHYRLPTEAEWEYACRAGTSTMFNTGDTLELYQARFATIKRWWPKPTAPVGSYPPNAWGLYDMHGNVWEWTADWFSAKYYKRSRVDDPAGPSRGTHHTLRGGSASMEPHECRTAIRGEAPAVDGPETETEQRIAFYGDFGIRVICLQSR